MAAAISSPIECCTTCDCTDTETTQSLLAAIVANLSFANYSAVRSYTGFLANQGAFVAGRVSALDGGEGVFIFISTSTTADNDGSVLKPSSVAVADAGRWHRLA